MKNICSIWTFTQHHNILGTELWICFCIYGESHIVYHGETDEAQCAERKALIGQCVRNVFLMFTFHTDLWCWMLSFFFFNGSNSVNSYLNFITIKWYWWKNKSMLFKSVLSCWTSLLTALQFKLIFWVLRHLLVLETFKWTQTHGAFGQHSHNLTPSGQQSFIGLLVQ